MSAEGFVLAPYPGWPVHADARVTGTARREGAHLQLTWCFVGPHGGLGPAEVAERRRGLWEETCFEFFLRSPLRPGYWEFNLSPGGHWNVYHFEAYRSGMTEEAAFQAFPFRVSGGPGRYVVSVDVDLGALGLATDPWELAIATVVAFPGHPQAYFALAHPGPEPDFHHLDAFAMRSPGPSTSLKHAP